VPIFVECRRGNGRESTGVLRGVSAEPAPPQLPNGRVVQRPPIKVIREVRRARKTSRHVQRGSGFEGVQRLFKKFRRKPLQCSERWNVLRVLETLEPPSMVSHPSGCLGMLNHRLEFAPVRKCF